MNIYGYPQELDYTDMRPLPPNWYRFDNLKRTEVKDNFEIPEKLKDKPGKHIFFDGDYWKWELGHDDQVVGLTLFLSLYFPLN